MSSLPSTLSIFSPSHLALQGGPYNQTLHDVLGAYACYRPDVGYVQGMSFLAAVLLLNMDACDAFVAMTNLLNRPSYLAFFRVDHELMQPYFNAFTCLLHETLPHLSAHFTLLEFTPEFYLIEWLVYRMAGNFRGRKLSRFDTKREFHGENFRGLLRYRGPADFQLLCRRGHKILRRKLSSWMVLKSESFLPRKFSAVW